MKRYFLIFLIFIFFNFLFLFSYGQDLPNSTKQQLESLADATEEETEDDAYLQQLAYLQNLLNLIFRNGFHGH